MTIKKKSDILTSRFVHILKSTIQRLFVSSSYLFKATCFDLTGHHQVYKIVEENSAMFLSCCISHFTSSVKRL
jgi:hypothetical protein